MFTLPVFEPPMIEATKFYVTNRVYSRSEKSSKRSIENFSATFKASMAISGSDSQSLSTIKISNAQIEVDFAKCDCCGLTEECTPAYIARVRERHQGKWICGLCGEAVKDEIFRTERLISSEEALNRHMNFYKNFRSSSPPSNPTAHLISAMSQLLRRSFDSPRVLRSTPNSPRRKGDEVHHSSLARSESCFSTLAPWTRKTKT